MKLVAAYIYFDYHQVERKWQQTKTSSYDIGGKLGEAKRGLAPLIVSRMLGDVR
jgi:hypothetical protein